MKIFTFGHEAQREGTAAHATPAAVPEPTSSEHRAQMTPLSMAVTGGLLAAVAVAAVMSSSGKPQRRGIEITRVAGF
jgi:hypothetical protein